MALKLKKVTEKLAKVRDSLCEKSALSAEDEATLKSLLGETLYMAQDELQKMPNSIRARYMPLAENDNTALTPEQKFRLRLMEKTGTGSTSIH